VIRKRIFGEEEEEEGRRKHTHYREFSPLGEEGESNFFQHRMIPSDQTTHP